MMDWINCIESNINWLLESGEPWTAYRTRLDLLGQTEADGEVQADYQTMLAHCQVQGLIIRAASWPGYALRRHNDTAHPLYALSTLADFGLSECEPGICQVISTITARQSAEGAFLTQINIPKAFGGTDQDQWTWMLCDSPTLLYTLLAMGREEDPKVRCAALHLVDLVQENGWRCTAAPELGKFKGPGRRADPCPIANVYALKALSFFPEFLDNLVTRLGAESLLNHWQHRAEFKPYLFGIGTDFHKLKYPFIWYDILHVVEVLSHYEFVHTDPRFKEMVEALLIQADPQGRFTARSMYQPWKGWSFADKKKPSPWLTFLVYRILRRIDNHHYSYQN